MSEKVASLYAEISADTSKLQKGLKDTKTGLTDLKSGVSGAVQNLTGLSLTSIGVAGALTAVGTGLKFSIDQAAEAERVQAKLNAVLKSTGGAAGLSADELGRMATRMSDLNAIDDEVIANAQTVLLTFRNIGREAFPQAMQAALDLSAVMGQDLQSSIVQIGKALNDPIQGMTALKRVGVSFSEDQANLIKKLQESGDMMGAQKIILKELSDEFGGAGAAAADTYQGKIDKLKISMGNLGQTIGEKLIHVLTDAADAANLLMTWQQKLDDAIAEHNDDVAKQADTYGEYTTEMIRAGMAAEKISKVYLDYADAENLTAGETEYLQKTIGLLTKEQWNAIHATQEAIEADQARQESYKALVGASGDYTASIYSQKQYYDTAAASAQNYADQLAQYKDLMQQNADLTQTYQDAVQKLRDTEKDWEAGTGKDVASMLKSRWGESDRYKQSLKTIDEVMGTHLDSEQKLKDATQKLVDEYGRTGDLDAFKQGLAGLRDTYEPLSEEVEAAKSAVEELQDAIDALHSRVITISVIAGSGSGAGPGSYENTPGPGQKKLAGGADFIVPPGYPNDSYPMWVQSGERVQVTQTGGASSGGNLIIQSVTLVTQDPADFLNKLGKVARRARLAGAAYMGG